MSNEYYWKQDEIFELEEMLRRGMDDHQIGRRFHRTANAVNLCKRRYHLGSVTTHTLSARHVGQILGRDSSVITWWCARGWLRARKSVFRGKHRQWLIEDEDLTAFLEEPTRWMLWRPEDITDIGLREWALELPRFRWLRPGEVAVRYRVAVSTVSNWIEEGRLPTFRCGNHWIAEHSLDGFELPCERSKSGMKLRRWTAAEDARLIALRASGLSYRQVALAMGRTVHSVANRMQRLEQMRQRKDQAA